MYRLVKILLRAAIALLIILSIVTLCAAVIYRLFPAKHSDIINKYCDEFDVSPHLVMALIKAESNFDENAVSRAGAKGLMQLTDETFKHCANVLGTSFSSEDIFNPEANISAGVWYISYLLEKYDGNITNAVAAYNAGLANVDKWLSDSSLSPDGKTLSNIPYGETKRHCEKIKAYSRLYKFLY
ncbi:MAG: lytic transglycosylase domain-containing protein [Clostridia bacterium]|nr:lytic transglycosylase domain-containing protein [Clostridia bacterium]